MKKLNVSQNFNNCITTHMSVCIPTIIYLHLFKRSYYTCMDDLTNMIVYDIETFSTIKCIPYANCIYRLSKISGKYYRDIMYPYLIIKYI